MAHRKTLQDESKLPGLISRCKNVKFTNNIETNRHVGNFCIWFVTALIGKSKVIHVIVVVGKENSLYICKIKKIFKENQSRIDSILVETMEMQ